MKSRFYAPLFYLLLCIAPNSGKNEERRAPHPWPNTLLARVEALALLQTLNADLLTHESATATLERWCAAHRLAAAPIVVAERILGVDKLPTDEQRRELRVTEADPVRYRRVNLRCGTTVLSEADNWYVPSRLTREMNQALETTTTPFGRVVQALHFQRRTLSAKLLWLPLPPGWEMSPPSEGDTIGVLAVPPQVLQHRALLTLQDGRPFSEVIETYTDGVLAFPLAEQ